MSKTPVNTEKLARFQKDLEVALDNMEQIFLKDHKYLCGDDLSIGDLLGICEVMQPMAAGHSVFTNRPKLEAWANRVKERLHPHFDEANVVVYKVKEMFGSKI